MSHKCTVRGCRNQLDPMGVPVEYCDYQQGRCPMQKPEKLSTITQILIALMLITITCVIYLTM